MVSGTDGCSQTVAAKFIAPTLPAQLALESRDGAGMPGLGALLEAGWCLRGNGKQKVTAEGKIRV